MSGVPRTAEVEAIKVAVGVVSLNLRRNKKLRLNYTIKLPTDETQPTIQVFSWTQEYNENLNETEDMITPYESIL